MIFFNMTVFYLMFLCQVVITQQQGLTIPLTSLTYKSESIDSKPLTISFKPIEKCNLLDVLSFETADKSREGSQFCDTINSRLKPNTNGQETYVNKMQKLNPNIAIASQISELPDIKLPNLCNNYAVPMKEDRFNQLAISNTPIYFNRDTIPQKECSIDVKPKSVPICSKTSPASILSSNHYLKDTNTNCNDMPNYYTSNTELLTCPRLTEFESRQSNIKESNEGQQNIITPNNTVRTEKNLVSNTQPCKISALPCTNMAPVSNRDNSNIENKTLYPLSNVIFCLGSDKEAHNKVNDFLKTSAVFLENKSDSSKNKQINEPLATDNMANKLNVLSTTDLNFQNGMYTNNILSLPSYQYPPITSMEKPCPPTANHCEGIKSPSRSVPVLSNPLPFCKTNTKNNHLGSFLNELTSVLTTNILSAYLNNNWSAQPKEKVVPINKCSIESNDAKRPNIANGNSFSQSYPTDLLNCQAKSNLALCCAAPIEPPAILPSPKIDLSNKDFIEKTNKCSLVGDVNDDKKHTTSSPIPYIASITINVTPSNEVPNNIVIVI